MFKRPDSDETKGCTQIFWAIIDWPLNFLRDLTIPAGDREKWDRTKMSIVPVFLPMAFLYLFGFVDEIDSVPFYIGAFGAIPGIAIGIYIRFCTKVSGPPDWLMSISAFLCFVMSIGWINFTSDLVVDTIALGGRIIDLPGALLNMTVLAWGNCLGDMSADVAMTKKGFGEMAITATMAGPIFNIMVGGFLSNFVYKLQHPGDKINFTAFSEDAEGNTTIQPVALLPILMLSGQVVCLLILLGNAVTSGYKLGYKSAMFNVLAYLSIIGFLVYWAISQNINVS